MRRHGPWAGSAVAAIGGALALLGASLSPASALPVGAGGEAAGSPLLLQVQVGEHLKYPGYKTPAGKAARAHRNAPHYICDKRPEECR